VFLRRRRGRWAYRPDAPVEELGGALPTLPRESLKVRVRQDRASKNWHWEVVERPSARVIAHGAAEAPAVALNNGLRVWWHLSGEDSWDAVSR
jgi:hypothetical protein